MATENYDIPRDIEEIYTDLENNNGEISYSIIDYNDNMSMDNIESMEYFLHCVNISDDYVLENYGTQVILKSPNYDKKIVIDSGGLGDFYSHGFDCYYEN